MKRNALQIGLLLCLAAGGCTTTPPPPTSGAFDPAEVKRIFAAGRSPGDFFIHVHPAESGETLFTGQNRQPSDQRAVLLFESPAQSALPVIRGRTANGAELLLLTDTVARQNWTNLGYLPKLGFEPLGPQTFAAVPAHLFDDTPGYLCVLPELTFDRMTVSSVLLYARPEYGSFWPMHRHADAREAMAVMGVDLLRSFAYVTWDYSSRLVTLSSTTAYEPDRANVLAELPINFDPDLGAIEIPWVIEDHEGAVIFDCAGDYEIALESPPLDLIRQIGLQDLVFRRVHAVAPADVGLKAVQTPYIGTALLRRYRVTLDNRRNTLWIESPLAASPAPAAGTGLAPRVPAPPEPAAAPAVTAPKPVKE